MTLGEYVETYILEHDVKESTAEGYRYCVKGFENWHGGPIDIHDHLTTDLANKWLDWLKAQGRSNYTRKSRRGELLTIWRAMKCDQRIDFHKDPDYVKRIRVEELDVDCFTLEQAQQLLEECDTLPGMVGSTIIPRSIYYRSFVMAAWDSGLRLGDLWDFDSGIVETIARGHGGVRIRQNKTGRFVDCYFHPGTVQAMQECLECVPRTPEMYAPFPLNLKRSGVRDDRPKLPLDRVWPRWTSSRKPWLREFRKVVERAGLKGGTKFLRRGAATEAEYLEPGTAARKLGHSPNSSGVAEKHYISRKVLPMAPVIGRGLES